MIEPPVDTAPPAGFWRRRFLLPIRAQLTQGVSPSDLARGIAVGVVCGIFPILGTTSLVAGAVAVLMRLNQAVIQSITVVLYPLHLLMIPVYIRAGEWLFGVPAVSFSIPDAARLFLRTPLGFFEEFGMTCVHCIVAWTVSAFPFFMVILFLTRPLLEKTARRLRPGLPPSP